jgi:VWFA-related protein
MAVCRSRLRAGRLVPPFAATLFLGLSVAAAALAQPEAPFREAVDVDVVEIDVVVTDRKGRPVRGLKREDFELVVDGRPVDVSNFAEAAILGSPREWTSSDANGGRTSPLTIVLYLDGPNTYPQHRERLLARLEQAVDPLSRLNARFMLAALDERVEILVPPTPDLNAVLAAAAGRSRGSVRGGMEFGLRELAIREMLDSDEACASNAFCRPCVDNWDELMTAARGFAAKESSRVDVALEGLADLVTTLAGVDGRKAIVHMSSGLPQESGLSLYTYLVEQICPAVDSAVMRNHGDASSEMTASNKASRFNLVSAHANANRATIFSLDAAGIRSGSGTGIAVQSGRTALGGRAVPSPRNESLHASNAQQGLFLLANETGGKALFNSNDAAELLADVAEEVSSTYSLGFLLADRRPRQVRQVEVRLAKGKAKGREVRYRRSFRDKTLDERLAERLLSVAYLGGEDNPLGARATFAPTAAAGRKLHALIVEVAVPADAVTLLPGPEGGPARGRLRLWMLAVDEAAGVRTTVRQTAARVGAGAVSAIAGAYRFEIDVALPEGLYQVAVGVRDEATGVLSLIREEAPVPLAPPE